MQTAVRAVHVPLVTLHVLLGGSSVIDATPGFRPNRVARRWPCGCAASHLFDRLEDAAWLPCPKHSPPA